jgi:hypothetical protein
LLVHDAVIDKKLQQALALLIEHPVATIAEVITDPVLTLAAVTAGQSRGTVGDEAP